MRGLIIDKNNSTSEVFLNGESIEFNDGSIKSLNRFESGLLDILLRSNLPVSRNSLDSYIKYLGLDSNLTKIKISKLEDVILSFSNNKLRYSYLKYNISGVLLSSSTKEFNFTGILDLPQLDQMEIILDNYIITQYQELNYLNYNLYKLRDPLYRNHNLQNYQSISDSMNLNDFNFSISGNDLIELLVLREDINGTLSSKVDYITLGSEIVESDLYDIFISDKIICISAKSENLKHYYISKCSIHKLN